MHSEEHRLELMSALIKSMMPKGPEDLKQVTTLLLHSKPENKNAKKLLYSALQVGSYDFFVFLQLSLFLPQDNSNMVIGS